MNDMWIGEVPTHCDICDKPIEDTFLYGKTAAKRLSVMCQLCHDLYGVGLCQKYVEQDDGEWNRRNDLETH